MSKQRWKSQNKNQAFSGAYEYHEWSENWKLTLFSLVGIFLNLFMGYVVLGQCTEMILLDTIKKSEHIASLSFLSLG